MAEKEEGNISVLDDDHKEDSAESECSRRVWESSDFTVTKIITLEGDRRQDRPRFGATGQVVISGLSCSGGIGIEELTDDFFYSKYFNKNHSGEVQIGNADSEVDKTLERCIRSMYPGEKCEAAMRVRFDLAKNLKSLSAEPSKPELWIEIECKLFLESLLNAQPIFKWYPETKFEKAKEANSAAVRLFKTQRFLDSFHKFHLALTLLTYVVEEEKAKKEEKDAEILAVAQEMRLTCFSNLAACQFQWGNFTLVVDLATKVLEDQPDNVKLLYRRGVSHLEMKDFEAAKADLVEAHRLDPSNKAINEKMGQLRVLEKKHSDQLAQGMKKMFA